MMVWMPAVSLVVRRVCCLAVKWVAVTAGSMDAMRVAPMVECSVEISVGTKVQWWAVTRALSSVAKMVARSVVRLVHVAV